MDSIFRRLRSTRVTSAQIGRMSEFFQVPMFSTSPFQRNIAARNQRRGL